MLATFTPEGRRIIPGEESAPVFCEEQYCCVRAVALDIINASSTVAAATPCPLPCLLFVIVIVMPCQKR